MDERAAVNQDDEARSSGYKPLPSPQSTLLKQDPYQDVCPTLRPAHVQHVRV